MEEHVDAAHKRRLTHRRWNTPTRPSWVSWRSPTTVVDLLLPALFRATGRVDSRLGDKRIGGGGGHRTDPISSALTEARTKTVAIQSAYECPRETLIARHSSFDRAWAVRFLHEEETRVGERWRLGGVRVLNPEPSDNQHLHSQFFPTGIIRRCGRVV